MLLLFFNRYLKRHSLYHLLYIEILCECRCVSPCPEGVATSLPLRREGVSKAKAILIGQASGLVEPFAGVLGCIFAYYINSILPILLSFSAGAMIATCVSELIPESSKTDKTASTLWFTLGFITMMILDVALG